MSPAECYEFPLLRWCNKPAKFDATVRSIWIDGLLCGGFGSTHTFLFLHVKIDFSRFVPGPGMKIEAGPGGQFSTFDRITDGWLGQAAVRVD